MLKWNFYASIPQFEEIAEEAFNRWSNHANITFVHDKFNPDIIISFKESEHYYIHKKKTICLRRFYEKDTALAHADYPGKNQLVTEIHINNLRKWSLTINESVSEGFESLFVVLLHEIGHVLGIEHSNHRDSVMYPFYKENKQDLHWDDVRAVQALYGRRISSVNTNITSPAQPTSRKTNNETRLTSVQSTSSTTAKPQVNPKPTQSTDTTRSIDFCKINNNIDTFLVINDRVYVFYGKYVWNKKISDDIFKSNPILLSDWLPFLPKDFSNVSAVYQRPNGNIVLFANKNCYNIQFPSFQLESRCDNLLPQNALVTGVVNTNTGRTFMFYNSIYFSELSECELITKNHGVIEKEFPGIPPHIDGVFRFTNGRLYFFKNNIFYEYDEYSKVVSRAGPLDLSIFNINCPNIGILQKLKNLLVNLASYTTLK